jgi:uncharacterized protein YjbJ (UPF0337 family)
MAVNKETIKGKADQVVGKVEAAAGEALGDHKMQFDGTVRELKGKAEEVYGKAKDAYGKASVKAKEWADKAPETAREARERAQRIAEESQAKVKTVVQEQPVAVLAGGIALGFVVGWLMSGRRN